MESIFSNFDDERNQIICRIDSYIENFKVSKFEGVSNRFLPLDIRLYLLLVQDGVVDDDTIKKIVEIPGRRTLKDELEEACHITV